MHDVIKSETFSCDCGNGTIIKEVRENDWLQISYRTVWNCSDCEKAFEFRAKKRLEKEKIIRKRKDLIIEKARELAQSRYLEVWLNQFEGFNKKQAWVKFVNQEGYPSLQSFYSWTKGKSVEEYCKNHFYWNFEEVLNGMGIVDEEIETLLKGLNRVYSD